MKSKTWLILAIVGGVLLLCCAGSGALMLLGAASGEGGETASQGSGLEGAWINGSARMTSYRSR